MPRLVAQLRPSATHRGQRDEDDEDRPDGRQQHPGVVPHEFPELDEHVHIGRGCIAQDQKRDVGEHERERPEADEAVHPGQPVATESPLEQGDTGKKDYLVQQEIRRDQPGQAAKTVQRRGVEAPQVLDAAAGDPQGQNEQARDPDDGCRGEVPCPAGGARTALGGSSGGRRGGDEVLRTPRGWRRGRDGGARRCRCGHVASVAAGL